MTIRARWPRMDRRVALLLTWAGVMMVLVGQPVLALILVLVVCAWAVSRLRLVATGGGFRPLRTVDMIDFNASDHLDAFDREQAMEQARRRNR